MDSRLKELLQFEEDYTAGLKRIMATTDTAVSRIKDGFGEVGSLLGKVAEADTALQTPKAGAEKGMSDSSSNLFWFMKEGSQEKASEGQKDSEYFIAKETYFNKLLALEEEHSGKKIALKLEEYSALKGFDDLQDAHTASKANIRSKAYSAMEKQMLSLVETKKFSVKAFGAAVAQQVKLELVGLAAKAAVWSIFETAMGFKDLATPGMQGVAAMHFKSATHFAAVSGLALAGAAVVQSVAFGGAKNESTASTGSTAANSLKSVVPLSSNVNSEPPKETQHVTIVINNPLSEQNWQQIAEDNIIPAINEARDRNIELEVVRV